MRWEISIGSPRAETVSMPTEAHIWPQNLPLHSSALCTADLWCAEVRLRVCWKTDREGRHAIISFFSDVRDVLWIWRKKKKKENITTVSTVSLQDKESVMEASAPVYLLINISYTKKNTPSIMQQRRSTILMSDQMR